MASLFDWATSPSGLGTLGSLAQGYLTSSAQSDAAAAQTALTNQAASAAQFKPYSITTGFGQGFFNPETQQASYNLSPLMEAFRNQYYGGAAQAMDQWSNLDPQAAAQNYMAQQQGLLQPGRQAEDIALRNNMLKTGRIGLGLSSEAAGAGTGGMVNPQQFALDRARALADAQMAAQSYSMGQADIDKAIARAQGLFQSGAGVEQLGMGAMTTGADIGKAGSSAGAAQANALLQGGTAATQANLAAGLGQASLFGNMGSSLSGLFAPKAPPVTSGGYDVGLGSAYYNTRKGL